MSAAAEDGLLDPPQHTPVLALLDFLTSLHATKNPPVHRLADEGLYTLTDDVLPDVPGVHLSPGGESWLTVEYVDLPPAPTVPTAVNDVLASAVLSSVQTPEVRPVEALLDEDADDTQRNQVQEQLAGAQAWIDDVWTDWSQAHAAASAAKALYRDLFAQYNRLSIDRDSVEFLWGFGTLRWNAGTARVDYPLVAAPVEIDVDPASQALTVRPSNAILVQDSCLAGLELHDRPGLLAERNALADNPIDPWSAEITPLQRKLVRALHDHGVVEGEGTPTTGAPVVAAGWTLFVRRRRPDYLGFLDKLRELYRNGAPVPAPLAALVSSSLPGGAQAGDWTPPRSSEQLLLPLAANEEQLRILQLTQQRPGVVVQGPPGTGKTHTIANLISHYVAHGHRVLVLAEKERALHEVAQKVPAGIRALTVSVLGADENSRQQLESSITAIQSRTTGIDSAVANREITRLTAALDTIDRRIAETTGQMLQARVAEAQQLAGNWPCPAPTTPQGAAAWVRDNAHLRRIPDPLPVSTRCPLTTAELAELVRLHTQLAEDARDALQFLPAPSELPSPQELAQLHRQIKDSASALKQARNRVRSWQRIDATSSPTLAAMAKQAEALAARWRSMSSGSWLRSVGQQMRDPLLLPQWHAFTAQITRQRELIVGLRQPLLAHEITLPTPVPDGYDARLASAQEMLSTRGKLGVLARAEKAALAAASINGRVASTADEVALVRAALTVEDARRALRTAWRQQTQPVGGPEITSATPEVEVGEPLAALISQLALPGEWTQLAQALSDLDVFCDRTPSDNEVAEVATVCALLPVRARQVAATAALEKIDALLDEGAAQPEASGLWEELSAAVAAENTSGYSRLLEEVRRLDSKRGAAKRLQTLIRTLSGAAPLWTQQILTDTTTAGDAAALPHHWQWRQLEHWLDTLHQAESADTLQRRMEALAHERAQVVTDLVTERAWLRLKENLGEAEKRGLNEYLEAVKRYGKTGGTYKARRAQAIRAAMEKCKNAVPVWVMTSSRALTSFSPEAEPPFDVLILDEASQAGMESLPLLSLAAQTIVVGDDQQTSPENVGLNRGRVFELLDDHLAGIEGYQSVFDPDASLYDVARQRFPDLVMLVEHFRCLPEIIAFSNNEIYDRQIQPLRDKPPHPGWVPVGAIKVCDGYRDVNNVNQPEAEAIVELLARLHADPQYDGMSFGVVTLLTGGQAQRIDDLLVERLTPEGYRARRIQVGDPAAFQGAERDVMVVSTVVATDPANPTKRIAATNDAKARRRINVAASRAQQQLWVVHSVDVDRFHPDDLRGRLIRHCRDPRRVEELGEVSLSRCDSEFERMVLKRILDRGYSRVHAQHEVGSANRNYRIDLVVEGTARRLAVECDGERWHGPERWEADRSRQQVLERAGWTFERIRGSAFFRNPDAALEPLWQRLDELGIQPTDDTPVAQSPHVFEVVGGTWPDDAPGVDPHTVPAAPFPAGDVPNTRSRTATVTADAVPVPDAVPEVAAPLPVAPAPTPAPPRPAADAGKPTTATAPAWSFDRPDRVTGAQDSAASDTAPRWTFDRSSRSQASRAFTTEPTAATKPAPGVAGDLDIELVAQQLATTTRQQLAKGPAGNLLASDLYEAWATEHGYDFPPAKDVRRILNRALTAALRTGLIARTDDAVCPMAEYYLATPGGS